MKSDVFSMLYSILRDDQREPERRYLMFRNLQHISPYTCERFASCFMTENALEQEEIYKAYTKRKKLDKININKVTTFRLLLSHLVLNSIVYY